MNAFAETTDSLNAEAKAIVDANPPGRVVLIIVGGFFALLGWIVGRLWFAVAHTVTYIGLSIKFGYWQGAKVPADQRSKKRQNSPPRSQ